MIRMSQMRHPFFVLTEVILLMAKFEILRYVESNASTKR